MPERVLLDMLYLAWAVLDEQTHTPRISAADENGRTYIKPMLRELRWEIWTRCAPWPGEALAVSPTTVPPGPALVRSGRGVCPSLFFFNCYIFLGISDYLDSKRKIMLLPGG